MIRAVLLLLALGALACETAKNNAYDREYERLEREDADRRAQDEAAHTQAQRYAAVVYFALGSAELDEDARRQLRWFADKLAPYPEASFDVQGFADATGGEATNARLSGDRARAVSGYLHSLGIEPARMKVDAFSSASPAAANTTAEGRRSNRRVEVTVR
jgi:outer membrane protein OmpA-like peptidoglycan-associated protein